VENLPQMAVALELGQAGFLDIDRNVLPAGVITVQISVPIGYYGLLLNDIKLDPGQVVPNIFNLAISHKNVANQLFKLTGEKIRDGLKLFSWITSGAEVNLTITNLDLVNTRKFFASLRLVYFLLQDQYTRFKNLVDGYGLAFQDRTIYGGIRVINVTPGVAVPVPAVEAALVQAPSGIVPAEDDYRGG